MQKHLFESRYFSFSFCLLTECCLGVPQSHGPSTEKGSCPTCGSVLVISSFSFCRLTELFLGVPRSRVCDRGMRFDGVGGVVLRMVLLYGVELHATLPDNSDNSARAPVYRVAFVVAFVFACYSWYGCCRHKV